MSAFIGKIIEFFAFAVNAGKRFAPSGKRGFLRIVSTAIALMVFIGVGASLANSAYYSIGHDNYNAGTRRP